MDMSTIITFVKQFLATVVTLVMMIAPIPFGDAGSVYKAENPEELVMSFSAVSDIHVETNNPASYNAFSDLMSGVKLGENHDATVFLGDNVMNGQLLEDIFFYLGVKAVSPGKQNFVAVGNHDLGNGQGDYEKLKKNYLTFNNLVLGNKLENTYYYRVINGCYMIFLASEDLSVNDFVMSQEQFEWLEGVLTEAEKENATVFVFNHHPVNYLRGEDNESLAKLLKDYDNLLYVHGHIHDDLSEDNFYTYSGIDCVNLPRSTEVVDYEPGDGIVVEVYENEILVRGRDFIKGEWIEDLEYRYPLG